MVQSVLLYVLIGLLLSIAIADAMTGMIPDNLNVPFLLLSFLRGYMLGIPVMIPMFVGGGFFAAQWIISRGNWVGSGDILLATGIGAFLGSVRLLAVSFWCAYVAGAVIALGLLLRGSTNRRTSLAFGPFLATGAIASMMWGERMLAMIGW